MRKVVRERLYEESFMRKVFMRKVVLGRLREEGCIRKGV